MYNNKLFSRNAELTRSEREIIFFDYRGVINAEERGDTNNPHSKYPIYMTVSKSKICFYLHHTPPINEDSENKNKFQHHTNSVILTLSVDSGTGTIDNLTKHIQESFYETIDITPLKIKTPKDSDRNLPIPISYSTLKIFNQTKKKIHSATTSAKQKIILRTLFLDFIYTAEHTQIFQTSPLFNHVYAELAKNFLFRAIRNKAEYYYQREITNEYIRQNNNNINDALILFQLENILHAESLWIDTITDPVSEKSFHLAGKWMQDNKYELDKVFSKYNNSPRSSDIYLKYRTKIKESLIDQYYEKIRDNSNLALSWYLRKYQISAFFRILYGVKGKYIASIYYILLTLFASSLINASGELCYEITEFFAIVIILYPLVAWGIKTRITPPKLRLCSIVRFKHWFSDKRENSSLTKYSQCLMIQLKKSANLKQSCFTTLKTLKPRNPYSVVNIYLARLFAAICTAWCSLSIDDAIFTNFFDKEITSSLWMVIGLLSITLLFLYHEVSKVNLYKSLIFKLFKAIQLGLIAFFYSTVIGIFAMSFFATYYLQNSDSVENFYKSRVFVDNPDFEISFERSSAFVTRTLHKAIEKHDPKILELIRQTSFDTRNRNTDNQEISQPEIPCSADYGKTLSVLHLLSSPQYLSSFRKDPDPKNKYTIRRHDENSLAYRLELLRPHLYIPLQVDYRLLEEFDFEPSKQIDNSWIFLLKLLDDPAIYQQTLSELTPTKERGYSNKIVTKVGSIEIFNNMLIPFSIFAMFIGVFLQSIFSDKSVSDPG